MKAEPNDRIIRDLFNEQKQQDLRQAPAFDRTVQAARERRLHSAVWVRISAAAAVLIAVAATVAMFRAEKMSPLEEMPSCAALSNWQASTDGLLTLSSPSWGSRMTGPSDAWIDTDLSKMETSQE